MLLISYDYQLGRQNFMDSAMATARANAMEIDREFAVVEAALVALSTSSNFAQANVQAIDVQARRLMARQNIFNIVLEDAAGQQLLNTFRPYGMALPANPGDSALKRVLDTDATVISSLFRGSLSQRQLVSVGIPASLGPARRCVLTATMAAERFQTIISRQNYPAHWVTSILDRSGRVVARSHEAERYRGTKASPDVLQRLRERYDGAFETSTPDGRPILAVLARADGSEWTVAIGIPVAQLNAEASRKLGFLVLATALLLGSGLLIAWKVGSRLRHAIYGLITPALALGTGQPVAAAAYGLREADAVGRALHRASAMLQQARHDATHDVLTGLANRAMFCDYLERQLALAGRNAAQLAVLYLDLDHFKTINDTHGHAVGDELLVAASRRLSEQLRKSDMAARLGGDEFAVVLADSSPDDTAAVVDKLATIMARPYLIQGMELQAAASIGAAMFPESATDMAALLEQADQAMYQAKALRKRSPGR
ncbi:diguanylate cyclase domain-containing protein [Oxalobacteraceae bacterium A2-2]